MMNPLQPWPPCTHAGHCTAVRTMDTICACAPAAPSKRSRLISSRVTSRVRMRTQALDCGQSGGPANLVDLLNARGALDGIIALVRNVSTSLDEQMGELRTSALTPLDAALDM